MYRPLSVKSPVSALRTTSFMGKKGMNLRELPQLLDPSHALLIKNYTITAEGGLEKRKGLEMLFNASSATAITAIEKWTDDIYLFGYNSTYLAAYTISTDTVTDIKINFVENVTSIQRYGDYAFVASPGDKIGRVSLTLDYDGQTGNFTVGNIVTGTTSGATAIILEDSDAGAAGTLTLGTVSGVFQNNEAITDPSGGAAVVDGTLDFTFTSISAAPKARIIKAVGTRLYAGDLEGNRESIKYCDADTGVNPPFTTWTVGTGATQSGLLSYRNAGTVNVIGNWGDTIIAGCDNGKWAFTTDTIDSGGTLTKVDNRIYQKQDAGMKAAIQTDKGLFYVNSQGLWQMSGLGQEDIKFTDQAVLISSQLGNDFFENADFSDATMIIDDKSNQLLVSYREDSDTNNQVLVYNTQLKAVGIFTGWNISKFMQDDNKIYGGGALTSKVWQIFKNYDDDGNDIWYEFEQELNVGQLWTAKELLGEYIQGSLSAGTAPRIKFSIYDKDGLFISDKLTLQWSYATSVLAIAGWGMVAYGASYGGDAGANLPSDNFAGGNYKIKNFQRIRVNISGHDREQHKINWLSLLTKEKLPIRKRNLTIN